MYCAHCGREVVEVNTSCPSCGKPANGAPAASRGLPAIAIIIAVVGGAIVLVAMIGIVAAIAIPSFVQSSEGAKAQRTVSDMRMIATAVEAYELDNRSYPEASSIHELASILEPEYTTSLPVADAWLNSFYYSCWQEDPDARGCTDYVLVAPGTDGELDVFDLRDYAFVDLITDDLAMDVALHNGRFVQRPEGD